jgi:hypothetical protein
MDYQSIIADQRDAYLTVIEALLRETSGAAVNRAIGMLETGARLRENQETRCDYAARELRELSGN